VSLGPQGWPLAIIPTQAPPMQCALFAHAASVVQDAKQAAPLHA
jgi:hypothetical protein